MWNRAKTVLIIIILVAASLTVYFSLYLKATNNKTRTVGVRVGNKFRYNVTSTARWLDSNSTIPSLHDDEEWVEISITDVSGTNITGIITVHYYNRTEITMDSWTDAATGDLILPCLSLWQCHLFSFISPNLTAGDSLYNGSISIIDETIPTTYPSGVVRETNHITETFEDLSSHGHPPMYNYTSTTNRYWDKTTGVIVNWSDQTLYYYYYGEHANQWAYETLEYRIISSDLWIVS